MDDNGEVLATVKRGNTFDKTTSEKVHPGSHRVRTFADFAGEFVPIAQSEMRELKHAASGKLGSCNLVLLGFRPTNSIPFYHIMDSAYLIYPQVDGNNKEAQQDNRNAFINLRAAMLRRNVIAIGEVLFRVGWTSKLVVVYPLEEVLDDDGDQRLPAGFMVVPLPFEDDIRMPELDEAMKELRIHSAMAEDLALPDIKLEEGVGAVPKKASSLSTDASEMQNTPSGYIATEELVQATMNLIEKRTFEGHIELGEDLENAALQKFFDYIEAIAMEDPFFEARTDFDTEIPDEAVLKATGDQIEQFQSLLPPDDVEKPKAAGRKRKVAEDDSGINWIEMYQEGELDSCKVAELKKYLRSVGEPLSGKKSDLVPRVTEHIRKNLKESTVKMQV